MPYFSNSARWTLYTCTYTIVLTYSQQFSLILARGKVATLLLSTSRRAFLLRALYVLSLNTQQWYTSSHVDYHVVLTIYHCTRQAA